MVRLPSTEALCDLEAFQKPACVTIYVPFIAANAATNPMQIALKDAIKEAEAELRAADVPERVIRRTLRAARAMAVDERTFWPHYPESLALFLHSSRSRTYRLPAGAITLRVHVGQGFDVQPLLTILATNKTFALLVLDHHATQLYAGDRFRLAPVRLKGFPADMERTLNIDEFPSSRELHGIAPAYEGKGSEGYHSQYNVAEVDKQMLKSFFRVINGRLHRYLVDKKIPLIIAGVDYLLPLYRSVNTYKYLLPGELHGSFRRSRPNTLRERAWALLPAAET